MDKAKALLVVPLWLLAILGLLMGALRLTINRPGYFPIYMKKWIPKAGSGSPRRIAPTP